MVLIQKVQQLAHVCHDHVGLFRFDLGLDGRIGKEGNREDTGRFGCLHVGDVVTDVNAGVMTTLQFLAGIENAVRAGLES